MRLAKIPTAFAQDYEERNDATIPSVGGLVDIDDPILKDLYEDAQFFLETTAREQPFEYAGLASSARATVKAIRKAASTSDESK